MTGQKTVYKTTSGEEIKSLREEARQWRREAAKVREIPGLEPARLEGEADKLWDAARLEALTVYQGSIAKKTKKGETNYTYWYASWREGDKVKNVHLGSARKMDQAAATAKARKLKAEALGRQ